jgi:hypothetical protein
MFLKGLGRMINTANFDSIEICKDESTAYWNPVIAKSQLDPFFLPQLNLK